MSRKMLGGLILLNLCAISLSLSAGEVDITNQEVLNQLVDLRNFIDEKRDFTKESKGLKPVVVAYRSSASKIDGIMNCNLSFNTDALHLSIAGYSVQADGTPITLTINVEYEFTDYVGYTIKSATINATNTISGVSMEDIVDKNGNKRFIESDITIEEITGVTQTYGKWSLSGSHLLIVVAGQIADESVLSEGTTLANIELPSWINEKIVPVMTNTYIDRKSFPAVASTWGVQNLDIALRKITGGVDLRIVSSLTLTANRGFRVAFDLLIDNSEESEE